VGFTTLKILYYLTHKRNFHKHKAQQYDVNYTIGRVEETAVAKFCKLFLYCYTSKIYTKKRIVEGYDSQQMAQF
jgi:hypothetical protein